VVLFGSYYCYDNPAALHDQLHDLFVPKAISGSSFEYYFSMFYTAYSIPNVVLPFFGGLLADRWGAARCASLCIFCIAVGQCVVALGVSFQSIGFILFGRVLFGIGGESLCVAISALLQQVFAGAEVGLAMGLNLSVSRLGSVINNVVSPYLALKSGGVVAPFWFGAGLCLLSLLSALTLVPMSINNLKEQQQNNRSKDEVEGGEEGSDYSVGSALIDGDDDDDFHSPNKLKTPQVRKRNKGSKGSSMNSSGGVSNESGISSILRCSSFGSRFYLMVGSCIVVYGTVLPFNNVASALIIEKFICHGQCCPSTVNNLKIPPATPATPATTNLFHQTNVNTNTKKKERIKKYLFLEINKLVPVVATKTAVVKSNAGAAPTSAILNNIAAAATATSTTATVTTPHSKINAPTSPSSSTTHKQQCPRAIAAETKASYVMGIPFLVSAFMTPAVGLIADRFGGASSMTLVSPIVLVLVHFLLVTTSVVPIFPMVAQGIAYSMYAAALWPLIGRAVHPDDVGSAYGVTTALQNIGLATIPPVVAALRVKAGNYNSVESLFIVLSISGVVFGLGLLLVDGTYYRCMLNRPLKVTAADSGSTDSGDGSSGDSTSNGKSSSRVAGRSHQQTNKRRRLSDYDNEIPPAFFDDQRILEEATSLLEAEGSSNSFDGDDNSMINYGIN
jgi:MFS family permease